MFPNDVCGQKSEWRSFQNDEQTSLRRYGVQDEIYGDFSTLSFCTAVFFCFGT